MSEHQAGPKGQLKFIAYVLTVGMAVGFLLLVLMDSWLLLIAVGIAGLVVGGYAIIVFGVIEPGGNAIGRVIVQSGSSTPSVAQHSNIEAMEAKGDFAKAAAAYRSVIESEPGDIVACERLGQVAMRQLKDFDTALWAYRQAEQRSIEPRRKLGYAMLVAGIYRENLGDTGKAIVELRKILEHYPDAPNADRIRAELDEMKTKHFEGS